MYGKSSLKDIENIMKKLSIRKYCPSRSFEVVLMAERSSEESHMVIKMKEFCKAQEEVGDVHFISYINTLHMFEKDFKSLNLPSNLHPLFTFIAKELTNEEEISSKVIAYAIKFRLISIMYNQYRYLVDRQESRRRVSEELNFLASSEKMPAKKTGLTKSNINNKSDSYQDITDVPLEENEIILYDEFKDKTNYYIIVGLKDDAALLELININVNISAFIELYSDKGKYTIDPNDEACMFLNKIRQMVYWSDQLNLFQNTIHLAFSCVHEETAEDMLYKLNTVLKETQKLKLYHLAYLKKVKIFPLDVERSLRVGCLTKYREYVNRFPLEMQTPGIVLKGLIEEVCFRMDGVSEKLSTTEVKENPKRPLKCLHGVYNDCNYFQTAPGTVFYSNMKKPKERININKLPAVQRSFTVHVDDVLKKYSKSFKALGYEYAKIMEEILTAMPFSGKTYQHVALYDEKPHLHSIGMPPEDISSKLDERLSHFDILYLLDVLDQGNQFVSEDSSKDLLYHVAKDYSPILYNSIDVLNNSSNSSSQESLTEEEHTYVTKINLYKIGKYSYICKELLYPSVLIQKLFQASQDFEFFKSIYDTNSQKVLLQFYNDFDPFGIQVIPSKGSIRNNICLRDFCRYTMEEEREWIVKNLDKKITLVECNRPIQNEIKIKNIESLGIYAELVKECLPSNESSSTGSEISATSFKTARTMDFDFAAFDYKKEYFGLTGSRTIFHSLDDVKITLDTTHFTDTPTQFSVKLEANKTSLMCHYHESLINKPYEFNIEFEDSTRIQFIERPQNYGYGDLGWVRRKTKNKLYNSKRLALSKTKSFGGEFMKKEIIQMQSTAENLCRSSEMGNNADLLTSIKKALKVGYPMYKIKKLKFSFLRHLDEQSAIPLYSIIGRILKNPIYKKKATTARKNVYLKDLEEIKKKESTFTIIYPNGLKITEFAVDQDDLVMQTYIKKEYKTAKIEQEEYRIYSDKGYVLVKLVDKSIKLLRNNGEIITYSQPRSKKFDPDCEYCLRKDFEYCQKKLKKLFDKKYSSKVGFSRTKSDIKRKYQLSHRENSIIASYLPHPFKKISLLKTWGEYLEVKDKWAKISQLCYLYRHSNLYIQEDSYKRSDGCSMLMDKYGVWTTQYHDRTKITTSFTETLRDGWVFITAIIKYEHPFYQTVVFEDNNFTIELNNGAELSKTGPTSYNLNLDKEIRISIKRHEIMYKKFCLKCNCDFRCGINLKPFFDGVFNKDRIFLKANDSYMKEFMIDCLGNTRRNEDYLKTERNVKGCKHRFKGTYSQNFVAKIDGTGELLWVKTKLDELLKLASHNTDLEVSIQPASVNKKIKSFKFKRMFYQGFDDRFFNFHLYDEKLPMTEPVEKVLAYTALRVILEVMDQQFCMKMADAVEELKIGKPDKFREVKTPLKKIDTKMKWLDIEKEDKLAKMICSCTKVSYKMSDKIANWLSHYYTYKKLIRNKQVPPYFSSDLCTFTEEENYYD